MASWQINSKSAFANTDSKVSRAESLSGILTRTRPIARRCFRYRRRTCDIVALKTCSPKSKVYYLFQANNLMSNQNSRRLSDVTKQKTTDRASKLASSFLPDDDEDVVAVAVVPTPAAALPIEAVEASLIGDQPVETPPVVSTQPPVSDPVVAPVPKAPASPKPTPIKRETRKAGPVVNLAELISQPVPEGIRPSKMIMLTDEQHDMLRELHFIYKKPMVSILYNLLEPAYEALQRERKKGN